MQGGDMAKHELVVTVKLDDDGAALVAEVERLREIVREQESVIKAMAVNREGACQFCGCNNADHRPSLFVHGDGDFAKPFNAAG
jgi:hypothetical protein